jgi:adenosylcobinamide kinase / adenosylcobinamide-phosphate guanylyltransferase
MPRRSDARIVLVLGGARSGKSRHAEKLARESGLDRIYIATAQAGDAEMADRISGHRDRRGAGWTTVEAPLALAQTVAVHALPGNAVLVDCLTLWLSNLLFADGDPAAEVERLVETLGRARGMVILVSNEVGLGIVPDNALARRFRDAAGLANQRVAEVAGEVVFVAAGLPLVLKNGDAENGI